MSKSPGSRTSARWSWTLRGVVAACVVVGLFVLYGYVVTPQVQELPPARFTELLIAYGTFGSGVVTCLGPAAVLLARAVAGRTSFVKGWLGASGFAVLSTLAPGIFLHLISRVSPWFNGDSGFALFAITVNLGIVAGVVLCMFPLFYLAFRSIR